MKDKLSALLDGDLDEQSAPPVLDSIRRDRSLRTEWGTYCLIGDLLRGDRDGSSGFVGRVMAEIESEPTVLAPTVRPAEPGRGKAWRSLMPLAASVMGVAAVGWVAHTLYADQDDMSRVATAPPRVQASESALVAVRPVSVTQSPISVDPNREYVFAHQSMTGGGPLSGAIQHVRTVSDVRQDNGR
ncbi:sigma-E factor negative regulatory protein [Aromatoleum diolicum]|uniref:Anti-sigma 24 factor n=1 Tax=Aromatoleum diolicum TaxID=75796 RepID=A0ABX1Q7J2_9RHOO|nr:sigma-E factor negative regulatory protein [Aromatoleum diolicum]NMG74040.1 anti-sigma 24 factor [Aromatoleum diolicum]